MMDNKWPDWTHFALPDEAGTPQYFELEGMDNLAVARFTLPADSLDTMTKALGFKKPPRLNYRPFPAAKPTGFPDWWTPYEQSQFLGGQAIKDNVVREVLVEPGPDDDTLEVYLRAYQL